MSVLVVLGAVLLACGDGDHDDDNGADGARRRSTTNESADTTASTSASTSTTAVAPDAPTTVPAETETGATPPPPAPGPPTLAEGGGWRLAVSYPTAGGTIGPVTTLCTEVSGTSREPVVVLEVTQVPSGTTEGGQTVSVDGAVGNVPVRVELPTTGPGRYDLRVQLVADGERIDGVEVTIPGVALVDSAAEMSCG